MIIPEYIDMLDWANSLFIDFPDQDIPALLDVNEWKPWAEEIRLCPKFSEVPSTWGYSEFKDWAMDFYMIMIGSD